MTKTAPKPLLMPGLLRAAYWFDEGLRRARIARGGKVMPRSQTLVILHVWLGLRKPNQLAEALGISRQAVSRIIAELVEARELKVSPDADDGRGVIVELADERATQETIEAVSALEARLAGIIGEDRLSVLRSALAMDWGKP